MDNLNLSINSIFKSYNPTKPNAFANLQGGVLAPNIRGEDFLISSRKWSLYSSLYYRYTHEKF